MQHTYSQSRTLLIAQPHLFGSCKDVMEAPSRMQPIRTPLLFSRVTVSRCSSAIVGVVGPAPRLPSMDEMRMRANSKIFHTHTAHTNIREHVFTLSAEGETKKLENLYKKTA